MPRISVEAQSAARWQAGGKSPLPPKHIGADAKAIWRKVAASKPADWWDDANLLLLESYCDITVRLRAARVALDTYGDVQATAKGRGPSAELQAVEKYNRQLVSLATKLRLTVQSALRGDSGKAGERAKESPLLGGNVTALRRA